MIYQESMKLHWYSFFYSHVVLVNDHILIVIVFHPFDQCFRCRTEDHLYHDV